MSFDTKYLLDANKDFIYFTGKISKHIMSKTTQKLIGANINDLVVFDKFNKSEALDFLTKLQDGNFKVAKKEVPRPYLVLFAPKVINKSLEAIDKFPIGTYVKFKISYGYHKEKKKTVYSACELEYCKEHTKNIEKRYGTGLFLNSKFTPIDQITFKSDILIQFLDKIYDNQAVDIENILSLNNLINNWLAKGIEVQKRKEYEEECKKIELSKKEEAKQSSKALVEALQSVKAIYQDTLQNSTRS